jgi:hypothetical protein
MGKLKKTFLILLIVILVIPVLYYLSFTLICPAINDARADRIERELAGMPLPSNTEVLETASFCGNTSGTGNHVEIWAGVLIYSTLSENEIHQFFSDYEMVWTVPKDLTEQYPEPRDFIDFSLFGKQEFYNGQTQVEGYYIIGGYYNAVTQHDHRGH